MSRIEQPGLQVALRVQPVEDGIGSDDAMAVQVDVRDAAKPLRVSVYVDGDLVEHAGRWARGGYQMQLPGVRGRHVVTARAIDARGRWGGASMMVNVAAALPV